jgi:hypothetical protein
MELNIALGLGGWVLLIGGALVFGVIMQLIGDTRTGTDWLVDAIGAGFGALVASEFVIGWQAAGPVWDGLAVVPALLAGVAVGLVVDVATRLVTGGTYTHGAVSA